MSDNRYIITRSNYTLREKHKGLKNGNSIYVRDYMITTNLGGYDSGSIPYGESNFKFVHNQNHNVTRSFNNGNWLKNESGDTIWTLNNIPGTTKKEESEIKLKINQNSLRDFVYYGSCVELIRTSLENIINFFPGEIYVTDEPFYYTDEDGNTQTLGSESFQNPVVIYNPFNIDVTSRHVNTNLKQQENYNELRYFADSYNKYSITLNDGTACFLDWDTKIKNKECFENGEVISNVLLTISTEETMVINEYYYNGERILITDVSYSGIHIRPNEETINKVFETKFTDFERFLLNRDTNPIYTINIDVPTETPYGIYTSRTKFTLPVAYDWNIDINSSDYTSYVNRLYKVAIFYDEHYSNNLWENIVHESIKNMDIQISNPSANEGIDDYILGIGNVHGLMLAYARQFDDIKLLIRNIKSSNIVTYNENNNIPDYFLSDVLELAGWEVQNVTLGLDANALTEKLFPGLDKQYTIDDLNTTFMRNLKINSKSIFSRKGNRQAIEMLLSLFGLCSYEFGRNYYNCLPTSVTSGNTWEDLSSSEKSQYYDYKFDEYVEVAKPSVENIDDYMVNADETLCVEEINQQIKGDRIVSIVNNSLGETIEMANPLVGLPVRMVYLTNGNETKKYIIPWFDKTVEYDGKTYFQMYGGWDKIDSGDNNPYYTETLKYLNIVDNIGALSLQLQKDLTEGSIYYVTDISDYRNYYPLYSSQPSHYFYLNDITTSYQYANPSNENKGWEIISQDDVINKTNYGMQVYRLESIINEYRGNNPHVGFGKYDAGKKYLTRLSHIFDGAIDDGLFDNCSYTCDGHDVSELGFNITDYIDNVKCWYFVDNNVSNNLLKLEKTYTEITDDFDSGVTYEIPTGYTGSTPDYLYVGYSASENRYTHNTSNLKPYNFETQDSNSNDEAAANSIINIKNISIEFNKDKYNTKEFENYLLSVIMFYLNQLIPSTSILTVKYYIGETPVISGISK